MDPKEQLRRYLEQRREMGERELILDGMSVEEVMRIVGATGPTTPRAAEPPTESTGDWREVLRSTGSEPARAVARPAPPTAPPQPTPDILASTIRSRSDALVTVGFALETNSPVEHGRGKLVSKQLDLIVVNDATEPGAGFSVDTNRVTFIDRDGRAEAQPLLGKGEVADLILDRVERLISR